MLQDLSQSRMSVCMFNMTFCLCDFAGLLNGQTSAL